jgi:anaerobic selenocysteine-containing dehydrogenase
MKKTASGFERISWEDALSFAAEKLEKIRNEFGTSSLVRCGGAPVSYQGRDGFAEFLGRFGSANASGAANLCMVPRMTAYKAVTGTIRAEPDYENTNLVLFWGTNPVESQRFGAYTAYDGMLNVIPNLKKRGIPMICIDPFRSKTVQEADEWIKINPGTDVALGLAMIHVIIAESLYAADFVERFTTGFDRLKEHVKPFTPSWAQGLTGIPENRIVELARRYAKTKPAVLYEGNGLDMYANGVDAVRTIAILVSITGNLDVQGGNVLMPFVKQSHLPTTPAPIETRLWHDRFPIFGEVPFPAVKESLIRNEADRPRAMIVHHCNPALVQANEKRTRQALENLDFIMITDIFPTATTEMADLILPVASDFEDYGYRAYSGVEGGFLALARPIEPPVGESRSVFDVEYELAEKMGLHQDYPFRDTESWINFMLGPSGIDFQRLRDEQIVYVTPPIQYEKYIERGFGTPSGKIELYSDSFKAKGYSPIPHYTEPFGAALNRDALAKEGFPLLGSSYRPAQFVHTKLKNIQALSASYPEPLLYIHPQDAADRGIEEKDPVEAVSAQGMAVFRARLTEATMPGMVWIDFGWGNPTDGKANINQLTSDEFFDPVSGGTPNRLFPCDVRIQGE